MRDEKKLIGRIQRGDRGAFEEFVDAYGAQVHRLVRRYVDNASDAEDVTQEVFLELYRSIGGFRGEARLSTWVYRVAVNRCLRHCQREKQNNVSLDEQLLPVMSDPQADPLRCATRSELTDRVNGALEDLSDGHRDVVILCEMHGLTYQECASVLEIPVGTVKSRLSNAFRRLRTSLSGYVIGEVGNSRPETVMEKSR